MTYSVILVSDVPHNKLPSQLRVSNAPTTTSLGPSIANCIQPEVNDVILFLVSFIFVVTVYLLASDIGSPFFYNNIIPFKIYLSLKREPIWQKIFSNKH